MRESRGIRRALTASEKKNANQAPELRDEELNQVTGGYTYNGPTLVCSLCDKPYTPENELQQKMKICAKCLKHRRL